MLVVGVWSLRIVLSNSTTKQRILFLLTYIAYTYLNFRLVNHLLPHCRRPCIKASSYSTANTGEETPIRVAPKAKQRKRLQNVFLDNRGFPDLSDNFDHLLHNIDGGPVLRRLKHPAPDLNAPVDPAFFSEFIPEKHEAQMRQEVDLSHLDPDLQEKIYSLIREFWSVFNSKGIFVPVKYYECVIDTGDARPIAVKKILYGKCKTVIMQRCIAALAKVGHIEQITDGQWLLKALLALKPHQETVYNIEDFVWHLCVNYIPLNGVT